MLLDAKDLNVHYGKAMALRNVSLQVAKGSVVTIIGANGAGKSTILKVLSGLFSPTSGSVIFDNRNILGMKPHEIVDLGLVHIPEGRQLFPYLNVLENLKLGASLRKDRDGIKNDLEEVFTHFPILKDRRRQKAGSLSGGEQMLLAIARGLMAGPRLLLMDEPTLGLAPIMVLELIAVIRRINGSGVTVVLVEQNVFLALQVAHRGYVLEVGKIILEGDIEQFKDSELVKRAYLGE
ncbi:MAG: ABC transporter ATP-binding protein [Deltaproteobacteria bacterium]|nr:ABC transporter ATP-binding protein [Deltaproteobacteria bacterium]